MGMPLTGTMNAIAVERLDFGEAIAGGFRVESSFDVDFYADQRRERPRAAVAGGGAEPPDRPRNGHSNRPAMRATARCITGTCRGIPGPRAGVCTDRDLRDVCVESRRSEQGRRKQGFV